MIRLEPDIPELQLLRRAVRTAQKTNVSNLSLFKLAPKRSFDDLTSVARAWQKAELGRLIEEFDKGLPSDVFFSLNEAAVSTVDDADRKGLLGFLRSITRSDWIAFAAFVVSAIALFKK